MNVQTDLVVLDSGNAISYRKSGNQLHVVGIGSYFYTLRFCAFHFESYKRASDAMSISITQSGTSSEVVVAVSPTAPASVSTTPSSSSTKKRKASELSR